MTPDSLLSFHKRAGRHFAFTGPRFTCINQMDAVFSAEEWDAREAFINRVHELCNSRHGSFDDYLDMLLDDCRAEGDGADAAEQAVDENDFDKYADEWEAAAREAAREEHEAAREYWRDVA